MKKVLSLLFGFIFLLGVISPVIAQDSEVVEATSEAEEINSFELFWPVVAGKTMGDSLYGLKNLKEKVRGWFIFGSAKKADYQISLATKRVVEAEKLLNDGKEDLALKTFGLAENNVMKGKAYWTDVENKANQGDIMNYIKNQLTNIEKFLNYLESKNEGDIKSTISRLNSKVVEFIVSF